MIILRLFSASSMIDTSSMKFLLKMVSRLFLYGSRNRSKRRQQILARKALEAEPSLAGGVALGRIVPDELKAAIILFFTLLDEKQRRLYAGLESFKFGHGGDLKIAELLGIDVSTVAKGRQQLAAQDVEVVGTRKAGGGCKPVERNVPSYPGDRSDHEIRHGGRSNNGPEVDKKDGRKDRSGVENPGY